MLNSEIKVILDEGTPNKFQGEVLEKLVKRVLQAHQYEVKENLHFTGLEIDLIATHKHKKEELYVECKAKEKVTSDEVKKFLFNIHHKRPDYGYFIRTKEIEQQAGALIKELEKDERYRNVSFFEPSQIIDILKEANFIREPTIPLAKKVTKRLLCLSSKGDYLIYILNDSSILPTGVIIIDANENKDIHDLKELEFLRSRVDEIKSLKQEYLALSNKNVSEKKSSIGTEIENISEVQSSEKWHDYLPASAKHFVGRDQLRNQFFDFFKDVANKNTEKRVFYLTGKSGWGKSSLVVEVKERCRNTYYKNRFFAVAIDSRSATSDNFVALSFERLIRNALKASFLKSAAFHSSIEFMSNVDILNSPGIRRILGLLKKENKYLILIFDQFEDVFRKAGLFRSFYKFLSDVTDLKGNIIVGFSWKTEILIPSDNEAYHYWQQAKEQAVQFSVPEFGTKEINGIINQLEKSTFKIVEDLQRRIRENSQGLPWLTKKLCIHIYNQLESLISQEQLIDKNLNIEELFKSDLERLDGNEIKALEFIAKRAFEGNFFEVSELGDKIQEKEVESLRDKRLIIRSGANYNIYWDIFRDYLVTKEVPQIGEAYILRYGFKACLITFMLFETGSKCFSISELKSKHPKGINAATLENILIELRTIGLVRKIDGSDKFKLTIDGVANEEAFKKFMQEKFRNYSPYLKLIKMDSKRIHFDEVQAVLKDVFKGFTFKDKTWVSYSNTIIGWLKFAGVDFAKNIQARKKGKSGDFNLEDNFLRISPEEVVDSLKNIYLKNKRTRGKVRRDLFLLHLIDADGVITSFASELLKLPSFKEQKQRLASEALRFEKMRIVKEVVDQNPGISAKNLIQKLPDDFFDKQKTSSKIIYAGALRAWFKNSNSRLSSTDHGSFLLSSRPMLTKALHAFGKGLEVNKHALRDFKLLGLVDGENTLTQRAKQIAAKDTLKTDGDLRAIVLEMPKYQMLKALMDQNPTLSLKNLYKVLPEGFLDTAKEITRKHYLSLMRSWVIPLKKVRKVPGDELTLFK
jgi:hypothetical protein